MELVKGLAAQRNRLYQSHAALSDALAAGEIDVAWAIIAARPIELATKGAPVAYALCDPQMAEGNTISIGRDTTKPHAAALFIDVMLSPEVLEASDRWQPGRIFGNTRGKFAISAGQDARSLHLSGAVPAALQGAQPARRGTVRALGAMHAHDHASKSDPCRPRSARKSSASTLRSAIDDATFERIRAAWLEHLVLLFRASGSTTRRWCDSPRASASSRRRRCSRAAAYVDQHPEVMIVSNVSVERARDRQPRQCRSVLAHRPQLRRGAARRELSLRARGAAVRRRYRIREHVSAFEALPADLAAPHRGSTHPARRTLQQRRLPARSAPAGHVASDRANASGDRPQGAVPRTPANARIDGFPRTSPRRCSMRCGSTRSATP